MTTFTNSASESRIATAESRSAGHSASDEPSKRVTRWASILYFAMALATPLLVYAGPSVMSPMEPMIADAAIDGQFSLHAACAPAAILMKAL
jgi:hypothetical protein